MVDHRKLRAIPRDGVHMVGGPLRGLVISHRFPSLVQADCLVRIQGECGRSVRKRGGHDGSYEVLVKPLGPHCASFSAHQQFFPLTSSQNVHDVIMLSSANSRWSESILHHFLE